MPAARLGTLPIMTSTSSLTARGSTARKPYDAEPPHSRDAT